MIADGRVLKLRCCSFTILRKVHLRSCNAMTERVKSVGYMLVMLPLSNALRTQHTHIYPLFNQIANPWIPIPSPHSSSRHHCRTLPSTPSSHPFELSVIKQPILRAKRNKMSKQAIEMPFATQMNQILVLCMINMCKHP